MLKIKQLQNRRLPDFFLLNCHFLIIFGANVYYH